MRARNNAQREVEAIRHSLPGLTQAQRTWAEENVFIRRALVCAVSRRAWCLHCGGEFTSPVSEGETVCPHCGKKLEVEQSHKRTYRATTYLTVIGVHEGWQVCRHFLVEKTVGRGKAPVHAYNEAVQNWIGPKGQYVVVARTVGSGYWLDAWNFDRPMEIRDNRREIYGGYRVNKYEVAGTWVYPHRAVLPELRRNGYSAKLTARRALADIPESEMIRMLLRDHDAEWLVKNRQWALLAYKWRRGYRQGCMPYAHSVRIAIRNRYAVKDAVMWMDYLDALAYFGKDTRNAHYVCPADLKAEHDRYVRLRRKAEAALAAKKELEQLGERDKAYQAMKGMYFGVCFGNERMAVTVIRSVSEMMEEGQRMHHCVFVNKYDQRPESLILSVKDTEGNRLATVEVDLRTFRVVQCRGVQNKKPEAYDEIIGLVKENMENIRRAAS